MSIFSSIISRNSIVNNNKKIIQVGDVIRFDKKYFIVLDVFDDAVLSIPCLFDKVPMQIDYSNAIRIKLEEKIVKMYSLDRDDCKDILQRYRNYVDMINGKKDTIKKQSTNNIEKIIIGSVVKLNEESAETFKVIDKIGDMFVCISCLDHSGKVQNPKKHYFKEENLILVKNELKKKSKSKRRK